MAGWSMIDGNRSVLDCTKTQKQRFELEDSKLRCLFYRVLRSFIKENYSTISSRPLPPMLGNGKRVDLFKLFFVVRENGGYNLVCKKRLWGLVTRQCGLSSSLASSLKLVYVKYLDALERWLSRAVKDRKENLDTDSSGCLIEIETELESLLLEISSDQKEKDEEYMELDSKTLDLKNSEGEYPEADVVCKLNCEDFGEICDDEDDDDDHNDNEGSDIILELDGDKKYGDGRKCLHSDGNSAVEPVAAGNLHQEEVRSKMTLLDVDSQGVDEMENPCIDPMRCEINYSDGSVPCSDTGISFHRCVTRSMSREEIFCSSDEMKGEEVESDRCKKYDENMELVVLHSVTAEEIVSQKRKRNSLWRMLSWITGISKNPCDPVVASSQERSSWKSLEKEVWKQVLLAREALFLKRHTNSTDDQSNWQKNQRMCPLMYDDQIVSGYKERLRCRKSLLSRKMKSGASACAESSSAIHSNLDKNAVKENHHGKQSSGSGNSESSTADPLDEYHGRHRVPIGVPFQVEVPEWTGVVSESDSKWLGTRIWPLEKVEHKFMTEEDPTGKGRQDSCSCQLSGSTECVRFHIAERKMKLKLELGAAFFLWRFDKMGEDVGLSWGEKEEKKFKAIVKLNPPSLDKSFWDEIYKFFRKRSREELVSYYFNVFLLQRRGYQNRVTPNNISSDDDDETEAGILSKSFGRDHKSKSPTTTALYSPKPTTKPK